MTRAVIIIPTHDHALMLPFAVRSAQRQTVGDVRIAVLGDGVGDDTRQVMADFVAADDRIEFLDRPKAGRTGEPHRDFYLSTVDHADIVTYLSDDDLLLFDHVEVMLETLGQLDFSHGAPGYINEHGVVCSDPVDFADPETARLEFTISLVSLTGFAHTVDAYRRLPYGWRETPTGTYTDQYMAQQFLSQPWCRAGAANRLTVARFPDTLRRAMTARQRAAEVEKWADRLATSEGQDAFRVEANVAFRKSAAVARRSEILLSQVVAGIHTEREVWAVEREKWAVEREKWAYEQANHSREAAELGVRIEECAAELERVKTGAALQFSELHRVESERYANEVRYVAAERELESVEMLYRRLCATRAVKVRDRLIRNRLLRRLFARGGVAR